MKFLSYAVFALSLFSLAGCKDDKKGTPTPVNPTNGSITVQFENYAGSTPLELNSATFYKNEHGDDFKVTRYKYYISNIILKGDSTTTFVEPESYHLINQEDTTSFSFVLDKVPFGDYTSIQVMIGVDSERNVSGAQTGALDPINGMFWTWNSGYIMAKMEGTSPQSPNSNLEYHITGFSGFYDATRKVELPFNKNMTVTATSANKIVLKSDILAWFKSPNLIDFSQTYTIATAGLQSSAMASNYANMLSVTDVQ